jgi:hypothetical protein
MAKSLALAALCLAALSAAADEKAADTKPEPARKGDRWEYAELHYSPGRAARAGAWQGGPGAKGGPGGNVQPAPGPARAKVAETARWVTGEGETEGEGWEGLAAKLKAPAAAKDAKPALHKVKLMNHLGREGWELVSCDGSVWTFKRKAAK